MKFAPDNAKIQGDPPVLIQTCQTMRLLPCFFLAASAMTWSCLAHAAGTACLSPKQKAELETRHQAIMQRAESDLRKTELRQKYGQLLTERSIFVGALQKCMKRNPPDAGTDPCAAQRSNFLAHEARMHALYEEMDAQQSTAQNLIMEVLEETRRLRSEYPSCP